MDNKQSFLFPMILQRVAGLPYEALYPVNYARPDWLAWEKAALASSRAALEVQDQFDLLLSQLMPSPTRTAVFNARKQFFLSRKLPRTNFYNELGSIAEPLRAAILEWQSALNWRETLASTYEQCLATEFALVAEACKHSGFQHALAFSSHELLNHIETIKGAPAHKKERQRLLSLFQYFSRGVFKTSPFSVLTKTALWRFNQTGSIEEEGLVIDKYATTPNVALLPWFYEVLLSEPLFYRALPLKLNPSLTNVQGVWRWLYFNGETEAFQTLHQHPVATVVIDLMQRSGSLLTFAQLSIALQDRVEADEQTLARFLIDLAEVGLLEWCWPEQGLTPAWPQQLAQWLAQLPAHALFSETAFLLQQLRSAAKSTAFLTPDRIVALQQEYTGFLLEFYTKHGLSTPTIPPTQLFYEDVATEPLVQVPPSAVLHCSQDLAMAWLKQSSISVGGMRARIYQTAEWLLKEGESVDFQLFCQHVFEQPIQPDNSAVGPVYKGKLGALMQFFEADGQWFGVVNALYPGGGKMYARWLHLFPSDLKEMLEKWTDSPAVPFPWHHWSNANFQPANVSYGLDAPGGRVGNNARKTTPFHFLSVTMGRLGPYLTDRRNGAPVSLYDAGLEAPEQKPPVMQVLWHLGVPGVSLQSLLDQRPCRELAPGLVHYPRYQFKSVVLGRAAWLIQSSDLLIEAAASNADKFWEWRVKLMALGIPRYFFVRSEGGKSKPQFIDMDSPLAMLLFEKILKAAGPWQLEEMLPVPAQWVGEQATKKAVECVVEFDLSAVSPSVEPI